MPKLVQKSGYIKPGRGGAGNYMEYIATRDGVELTPLEEQQPEMYLRYTARRPRSHGLFSAGEHADLDTMMDEVEKHTGPVWTFIYSLKREDAARLGYDRADSWQRAVKAHQVEFAQAMKIPVADLRWCAAYHDEGSHPHIHMMVWSADPKQGYLTEKGIEKMRSAMTNEIFRDELLSLYRQKELSYKEITQAAERSMKKLIQQMESSLCYSPAIAERLGQLSAMLDAASGKKVYHYLKKPLKEMVDAIVDELAALPEVADCYKAWNHLRDEVEGYYKDTPREHLPLSRQPEFKSIKNMVIREAENIQLGVVTFEDEGMEDEVGEEEQAPQFKTLYQMAAVYRQAKAVLYDDDATWSEKEESVCILEQLWQQDFTVAAHLLGKCYRDGLGVIPDDEKAEEWFWVAAEKGLNFSQYALGKLLQSEHRIEEVIHWYEKASAQGNQYADYRLGKLYLAGKEVQKDVEKALYHLTCSAEAGNQYAQYALGKLYLEQSDREQAHIWFIQSAAQGNTYAQFFLDHFTEIHNPSLFLSVTKLLHHLARTFRQNTAPPRAPISLGAVDRKLLTRIREKKIAMGHKPSDHEDHQQTQQQGMGGMTMGW